MRTIYSGALTSRNIDQEITICGWVHRRRDHGGVIFIDLRDREGLVQVVFDPDGGKHFQVADSVRSEYVLKIKGRAVRVWQVPSFENADLDIATPEFKQKESPF